MDMASTGIEELLLDLFAPLWEDEKCSEMTDREVFIKISSRLNMARNLWDHVDNRIDPNGSWVRVPSGRMTKEAADDFTF